MSDSQNLNPANPDPNVMWAPHIPEAVRRQAARAEELYREAHAQASGEDNQDTGENTTVVTEERPQLELTPPPEELPQQRTQPQQPQQAPQQQPGPSEWEQRYNTLQGKYNTELPELRGQVRSLQEMLAAMQQLRPPAPEPQPQPQFSLPPGAIPEADVEAYGEDLVSAAQRWAEARLAPRFAHLEQRLERVEGGNQQLASYTTGQHVEQYLNRVVPEWEQLNKTQDFITWLNQVDPFSGQVRKVLADEAYRVGDGARTAAFFQAYLREHTAVGQPPGIQYGQTGAAAPAARLPLAELAVPGRGAPVTSPTPSAPERRTWTGQSINAFYRDKQRGRFSEAEADRIERDIFAAQLDGRYQP